ncbi:hypothetical protein NDU88_000963 [Pleurodeles waltl]|uniref:Uncharacterized protein n=1 Tax=Pleurodeles waltl TaxID=8319 RepID=A0AAV7S608_PLEWA|nr:hypothetical protein NDU88_000963 [Pleurodeles waltl]
MQPASRISGSNAMQGANKGCARVRRLRLCGPSAGSPRVRVQRARPRCGAGSTLRGAQMLYGPGPGAGAPRLRLTCSGTSPLCLSVDGSIRWRRGSPLQPPTRTRQQRAAPDLSDVGRRAALSSARLGHTKSQLALRSTGRPFEE